MNQQFTKQKFKNLRNSFQDNVGPSKTDDPIIPNTSIITNVHNHEIHLSGKLLHL